MTWQTVKLGDVCEVVTGNTPSKSESEYYGDSIPWIKPDDLDRTTYVSASKEYLSQKGGKVARLLPKGTVLFSCIGNIGKIAIADCELATNQQINALIPGSQLSPLFLYYACRHIRPRVAALATSTTVPIINKSQFSKVEIPLPPLAEQNRIAAILDKADTLRQKRRDALQRLDSLTQAVFLDMFGDPVTNPKGWDVSPLESLGKIITGNTPSREIPDYYGAGIEWIKSDNINTPNHYLTEATESLTPIGKSVGRYVESGSILVTCIAGSASCIGNAAIANREVAFNQQINAITPHHKEDTHFLYAQFLVGKRLVQATSTDSMKGMVSKSAFSRIPFIVPPQSLRNRFTTTFLTLEKNRQLQALALAESDALFASLQARAFLSPVALSPPCPPLSSE